MKSIQTNILIKIKWYKKQLILTLNDISIILI